MPKGPLKRPKSCGHYKINRCLRNTPQGNKPITDQEEDEEEENEGDPEGEYANEERLTRVLALRDRVEMR